MIFLPGQLLTVDKGTYNTFSVWVEEVDYEVNFVKAPWCVQDRYIHWDYGWTPRGFNEWLSDDTRSVELRENVSRQDFIALSNAGEMVLRW